MAVTRRQALHAEFLHQLAVSTFKEFEFIDKNVQACGNLLHIADLAVLDQIEDVVQRGQRAVDTLD